MNRSFQSNFIKKNIVPILPYCDTYIKKYIFINLPALYSQKGPKPLTFAKSLQKGVKKNYLNKINMKKKLVLWPLKHI